jgi:hypothetical protein
MKPLNKPTMRNTQEKRNEARDNTRLRELDENYTLVIIGKHTRVLRFDANSRPYFMDIRDFKNALLGMPKIGKQKLADAWLEHAEVFHGVTFAPGDTRRANDKRQLNLWNGWGVKAKRGEWDLIESHITDVIAKGNEHFAEYVLNWVARMFQRPHEPGQTAIALRGEAEGAGKSLFGHILLRPWGINGRHISDTKHLVGHFNAHLQSCGLLFADEALWPGDKSAEGTLKRLITEPTLLIEPKGVDAYEVPNCVHLLLASNKDWVVPAGKHARRFAVNEVSAKFVGNRDYWEALRHQMSHGGIEAFFHEMLHRDISNFDVFDIPQTRALTAQKMHSLDPFDEWWQDLLEKGQLPGRRVEGRPFIAFTEDLREDLLQYLPSKRRITARRLGTLLQKRDCWRYSDGQHRGWNFPNLQEAREKWAKQMGSKLTWADKSKEWGE